MASPALPGLFFCFAACVLLIIVSVSAPTWNAISFLNANVNGNIIHFGVFGYTGSKKSIGYFFSPSVLGFSDDRLNQAVIHNLTKVLILHPIAAGLAGLAVIFGICGAGFHRAGTVLMSLAAALATLVTLVAFVIDMVLFGIARNRIRDVIGSTSAAQYGNANWLTLAAFVALVLGFCTGTCGSFGRYRRNRVDRI